MTDEKREATDEKREPAAEPPASSLQSPASDSPPPASSLQPLASSLEPRPSPLVSRPSSLVPRVPRELSLILAFVVLAVAMTWPLAPNLTTAVAGPGDPYLVAWILDWDYRAAIHDPLSLFHAPMFHPARYALAFTEHMVGIALAGFPLFAAGLEPLTVYNILMILGFALSGYGAYVLGRLVSGSLFGGLAAGIFFAFVPFRFTHITHLQHVWSVWLPLLLAALLWYDLRPGWKRGTLFGVVFLMNGLTNLHWFVFGSFAIVVTAIILAAIRGRLRTREYWLPIGSSTAIASLLLLPFLLPYRNVSKLYGMVRSHRETLGYSAEWSDWLVASYHNKLLGRFTDPAVVMGERWLFPGVVAIALAVVTLLFARRSDFIADHFALRLLGPSFVRRGALRSLDVLILVSSAITVAALIAGRIDWRIGTAKILRVESVSTPAILAILFVLVRLWFRFPMALGGERRSLRLLVTESRLPPGVWAAMLWIAFGLFGSVGLNGWFHSFLFDHLEIFRGIRVPARWSMITYVGLSLLVATGAAISRRRLGERWGVAGTSVAILLPLLLLFELRAAPLRWYLALPDPPPVYRWLATIPIEGALLELPISEGESEHTYLWRSTVHRKPLINGVASFTPRAHEELIEKLHEEEIGPDVIERLESRSVSLIVVHADRLAKNRAAVRAWLQREIARGRLAFIRRFDHDLTGDYVFAVVKNEPKALLWRPPDLADPSGRTPLQNAEVFLAGGGFTWNEEPFGMLDSPRPWEDVRGPLEVSGWVVSPEGVASVNLRFANGRLVVPAELVPRGDVDALFPWYASTPAAGFRRTFETIPPEIDGDTDLQVEIVMPDGRSRRLEDVWFRWREGRSLQPPDWKLHELHALMIRNGWHPNDAGRIPQRIMSIYQVGDSIVDHMECRGDGEFLDRLYRVVLDRGPDRSALDRTLDRLARGTSRRRIVEDVIQSEEFATKYLTVPTRVPPR
ncbi:MAG TPA: DUF4214 domain-containing protein [Thermoanaerobaculia bacterium]|nr:DUF4214 domain-containing protein [Thermoanaerobaculia bacterium]